MTANEYALLTCPLPGCVRDLHLTWRASRALYVSDLGDPPLPQEVWTRGWQVECEEGHVVLLPAQIDHDCENDCVCDVDHDEEMRTFRASDGARLQALLGQGVGR